MLTVEYYKLKQLIGHCLANEIDFTIEIAGGYKKKINASSKDTIINYPNNVATLSSKGNRDEAINEINAIEINFKRTKGGILK